MLLEVDCGIDLLQGHANLGDYALAKQSICGCNVSVKSTTTTAMRTTLELNHIKQSTRCNVQQVHSSLRSLPMFPQRGLIESSRALQYPLFLEHPASSIALPHLLLIITHRQAWHEISALLDILKDEDQRNYRGQIKFNRPHKHLWRHLDGRI